MVATLWACGPEGSKEDGSADGVRPVRVVAGEFRDSAGHHVVLRGVNARVAGLFDVTFDDGRAALEPIPVFAGEDCRLLGETLGMNLLRLPVNWSGIEPSPGEYDEAYLAKVRDLVDACGAHGIYVLVDLHQDAYSKHIGEDGAPLWAIVPPPAELLEGPLEDLEQRRLSSQVIRAFDSFFANAEGLQDAYAEMAAVLAEHVADAPNVVGLELMNEPVVPNDASRLDTFHARVATRVRASAPHLPLFFEPEATRNFLDRATVRAPFPDANSAYTPHVYTGVFTGTWDTEDAPRLRESIQNARAEAQEHGSALLIGEFGHDPRDATGQEWLDVALGEMDETSTSWALWLYEERSQGRWGFFDAVDDDTRGALREDVVHRVARPFPQSAPGAIGATHWDAEARTLRVELSPAEGGIVVRAPKHVWPDLPAALCDGEPAEVVAEPGTLMLQCAGAELVLMPR